MSLLHLNDVIDSALRTAGGHSAVFGDAVPTWVQLRNAFVNYMYREPLQSWASFGYKNLVIRKVARGFRIENHPPASRNSTRLATLRGMRVPFVITSGIQIPVEAPFGRNNRQVDRWLSQKIGQDYAGQYRLRSTSGIWDSGYIERKNEWNEWISWLYVGTVTRDGARFVSYELANALGIIAETAPLRRAMEFDYSDKRPKKAVRSGTGDINKWFEGNNKAKTTERIIEKFPIAEHGTQSSRRWGIEVEAAGARHAETPAHWERKHDGSLMSAYQTEDREYPLEPERSITVQVHQRDRAHEERIYSYNRTFQGEYITNENYVGPQDECDECVEYYELYERWEDEVNSYEADYESGEDDCGEFVSPPLRSFHSRGLETLCKQLSEEPQNDTAGVHVHVEVDDLSPKQIASLLYGYNRVEPLLVASYQRETREYCKAWDPQYFRRAIKSAKRVGNRNDIEYGDRYVSLNLLAMRYHNTIEFRAMGPVYDYKYLIQWAMFCREMVNLAKANVRPSEWNKVKDFAGLRALMLRKGTELVNIELGQFKDIKIKLPVGVETGRREREEAEENVTAYVDESLLTTVNTSYGDAIAYANVSFANFERAFNLPIHVTDPGMAITYDVIN